MEIKDFEENKCTVTIAQMEDDTVIFVKDLNSTKKVFNALQHFHNSSG